MYQLMLHRKNSKKGFTLVEVIVVLVILAILAAIMIPAMTGWIDKAKQKTVVVQARSFYLAAQTLASEDYASNVVGTTYTLDNANMQKLVGTVPEGASGTAESAAGTITSCTYSDGKYTATWNKTTNTWDVGDAPKK